MHNRALRNYLRAYRRKAGLSQKEVGRLLGYERSWQVGRHERSRTVPPLPVALAYQELYRAPLSAMFAGLHTAISEIVAKNVVALEEELEAQGSQGRLPRSTKQKLEWLKCRAKPE
jgi:DNA-binding XRE family transcriptional regulator